MTERAPAPPATGVPTIEIPEGVPDVFDRPVVGWRAWGMTQVSNDLQGRHASWCIWPARATAGPAHHATTWNMMGRGGRLATEENHPQSPMPGCSCGFHAWSTPERLRAREVGKQRLAWSYVMGAALFWGRTFVGPHGLRAEYATPLLLIGEPPTLDGWDFELPLGPVGWLRRVRHRAARYAIPVLGWADAEDYALEWGDSAEEYQ